MIPRYTTRRMEQLWSDGERFATWFDVEVAACRAWEAQGKIPAGTTKRIAAHKDTVDWTTFAGRVAEIEARTRHDVIAFLSALEEVVGEDSRFVHYGMTSSDVVDTSFARILTKGACLVQSQLLLLVKAMQEKAELHRNTLCLGRTHGQAAEVTTFGLKLLGFAAELARTTDA